MPETATAAKVKILATTIEVSFIGMSFLCRLHTAFIAARQLFLCKKLQS